MGAARLPKILVLTINDFVSAQCTSTRPSASCRLALRRRGGATAGRSALLRANNMCVCVLKMFNVFP